MITRHIAFAFLLALLLAGCTYSDNSQTPFVPDVTSAPAAPLKIPQSLTPTPNSTFSIFPPENSGNLFSFERRSDGAQRVTNGPGSDQNAAFFNNDLVVFTRFSEGYNKGPAALMGAYLSNGTIFEIFEDEAQNVNVNGNPFTPDRKNMCYSSDVEDSDEIWCIGLESKKRQRVTRHDSPDHFIEPSVSSAGKTIAFEWHENSENVETPGEIWVTDFFGNAAPLLKDNADNRLPMFNPSDNRILFQRRIGNPDESFWKLFIRAENGTLSELIIPTKGGTDASWVSTDQVVYSSDESEDELPKIYSFNLQTGKGWKETFSLETEDGAPAVSPDGLWLAFESHITSDESSPSRIWIIRRNES